VTPGDLIGASDASAILQIHRTTFWIRRKAGRYPEPVITVGGRPLFDEAEIRAAAEKELESA
jgi:predicted DNA-binding transcriptional regulator AlpA